MLTISQLAAYAGVTVRAVRHYHAKGLLPEPERDHSGYRRYDAKAVVRADQDPDVGRGRRTAGPGAGAARGRRGGVRAGGQPRSIVRLRREIRERQDHRRQIAKLAAGDSLSLPDEVVDYLDRMRVKGVPEALVDGERDGWILMAARWPEKMPEFMADKLAQLEDPRTIRLYRLIGQLLDDADGVATSVSTTNG